MGVSQPMDGTTTRVEGDTAKRSAVCTSMRRLVRRSRCGVLWPALGLLPSTAHAQTASTTAAASAPAVLFDSSAPFPTRLVNGVNLGVSTRPAGLNPDGVNYADCISDMTLEYTVYIAGFTTEQLEVWVSENQDCTQDINRGNGGSAVCWEVATLSPGNQVAQTEVTIPVRVQDLVGPQGSAPVAPAGPVDEGAAACLAQPNESAVTLTVYILPIASGSFQNIPGAVAFKQEITTDLVGPTAPASVGIADGDTVFNVNWTANNDADTYGYDVFIDPIPGSDTAVASSVSSPCSSQVLTDESIQDSGAQANAAADGEVDAEAGTTSTIGPIGVATIPCQYLVGASCPAGEPINTWTNGQRMPILSAIGENSQTITISGLTNYGPGGTASQPEDYNVVVAAVDASGNVGPPSAEACDYPSPVNDFYRVYRNGGGTAGGGFCALEAVGKPVGSSAAVLWGVGAVLTHISRRRHRRRSR
jgi:hypothetical protein